MLMALALILLSIVSFALAVVWRNRSTKFTELFLYFSARFDPSVLDLSGRTHHSHCMSYNWVMKNVVQRRSRLRAAIQQLMGDNTLSATMVMGMLAAILPFALAYLLVGGLIAAGGAIFVALAAVFFVQAPLDVDLSHGLLTWMIQQDPLKLKQNDFAYALVSSNAISRWSKILIAAGVISLVLAPVGDMMIESGLYGVSVLMGTILTYVFIPLAAANAGVAYAVFVASVVFVAVLLLLVPQSVYRIIKRGEDIFALEPKHDADESEQQPVEKEKDAGNH